MNTTLRYALDFAILIPTAIFAFIPVSESLRFSHQVTFWSIGITLAILILAGVYLRTRYSFSFVNISSVELLILFGAYYLSVKLELVKKLLCFFNSTMLCEFCKMYTVNLVAPIELAEMAGISTYISSGLVSLVLALVIGIIFFKTLSVKIPMLLKEERIKSIWNYMYLLPLSVTFFTYWITPISPVVVMTGRVRPISLVLMLIIPLVMFVLWHIFYWITAKLVEGSRLQQENDLLQMEAKRYIELQNYMNYTRALRHDFRQHISVINELAENNELDELRNYLSKLTQKASLNYVSYCANKAVDAIASHYDKLAKSQGTKIFWSLTLPAKLPINETDYCAMLGNLTENALHAVKTLPEEMRKIKIISSMPSAFILGISADNPYSGKLKLNKDGLPISSKDEGHGLGLISVKNTAERYGGTMNINTENEIFSVDIILYCNT